MPGSERPGELQGLRRQLEELRDQLGRVEARAEAAEREAHRAREEVLGLRDQVAAAERDQQDLRAARARLARIRRRGLVARMLNR
jgi:predicted  nucleic acid-binding Zn-ribbon protein